MVGTEFKKTICIRVFRAFKPGRHEQINERQRICPLGAQGFYGTRFLARTSNPIPRPGRQWYVSRTTPKQQTKKHNGAIEQTLNGRLDKAPWVGLSYIQNQYVRIQISLGLTFWTRMWNRLLGPT